MIPTIAFITGIILGVAVVFIYRFFQRSKKAFFKAQLQDVNNNIWGTEFALYTTRYEHEKTRQLFTQGEDQLNQVKAQLANKPDKDLEAKKNQLESKLEELKASLEDFDVMMNGCAPNERYPEGVRGLNDKIQAQVQKREHIKNFIKYNA